MENVSEVQKSYQGQWGGKIANGEEMWWSDYSKGLVEKKFFSRLWFKYDNRHYFLLRFLEKAIRNCQSPEPLIIDFGCGTGGTTLNFSNYLSLPWQGYDVFPTQISVANEFSKSTGNGSKFFTIDPSTGRIPLDDNSVDILYSADVLAHVPDIDAVLSEWNRVIKPEGTVVLYTEAACSEKDNSMMGKLAKQGIDMIGSVPEHISLFPRENLEERFKKRGFRIEDRISGNVLHFLFNPKEFAVILKENKRFPVLRIIAFVLDRLNKIIPFYPKPQHLLRILCTRAFGRRAYGCNYFYHLRKN